MTTKNQDNTAPELSSAEIAKHQENAKQELIKVQQQLNTESANTEEAVNLFPYGGTFSITGIGYILLASVTPMEFTNGTKFTYKGEGGGAAFGSGVFVGGGIFNTDPATLPGKDIYFAVAAGPGVPATLIITWIYNGRAIGSFSGVGISAFAGFGGGVGRLTRL
jgi:hypothetical protein